MIKVLTIVNTGVLVGLLAGSSFLYTQRAKFVDNILSTVQEKVLENVKGSMKNSLPKATGNVLPF